MSHVDGVEGYTVLGSRLYIDAICMKEMLVLVAVTAGDPGTAFPIAEGRYPQRPDEAAVSTALASLLDGGRLLKRRGHPGGEPGF